MACKDGECHEHFEKKEVILYSISLIIFILTFIPALSENIRLGMYVITILLAGYKLFIEGFIHIFKLKFEEDTLMTIAIIAACSLGEFREACLVILLFRLGEFIENMAITKSNKNIEEIVEMKVDAANVYQQNGELTSVLVESLQKGDKILIKPGEMVPVDCKVLSGKSNIDTSRVTGESELSVVEEGQEILSGNMNLSGSLTCEVIRKYEDSMVSQMMDLVYEATNNKGKTEKFITKFSKIYTPVVIILALVIAVFPAIIGLDAKVWITRALVFLVASCPCSIVISIPLAFFSCVGVLSKKGLLVKGTKHIENFAKAKVICFDKTGTITTGKMVIDEVELIQGDNQKEFFSYLYSLEHLSNHPIANSIENEIQKQGWKKEELLQKVSQDEEIPGHGMIGIIEGKKVLFGNLRLLEKYKILYPKEINKNGVYLAIDGKLVGYILLKEEIRKGLENFEQKLKKIGIQKAIILTGDQTEKAEKIAKKLGDINVYAGLLPKDKLEKVEELKKEGKVIFVGDGINDSPVLAAANFSISMGEGTQIASDTADSILISNQVSKIPNMIQIAKSSMNIIYFNMIFSLLLKLIVLILGIVGIAPIWLAVFADVGVTLITVLNSIRIYRK